ncbi:nuclear transport factor 2 family protein [Lewinella sp. W8]|uniref:nuclear transport factor 2 family protein n=1 Tax=Lewinella sp. W8 TaxID=2528208 RepID=UPI0034CE6828
MLFLSLLLFTGGCRPAPKATSSNHTISKTMTNKEKAIALIESLESGDPTPVSYINPRKYIQHNLAVGDGLEGFGEVIAHAPEGGFKAKVIRAFQDEDFVFLHSKYDFFGPKAGFDIFRFEEGLIVEHWDNLADITPPNPSGRTQLDGSTDLTDLDKTETNKKLVREFLNEILVKGQSDRITDFISTEEYLQHNADIADGLSGLGSALQYFAQESLLLQYDTVHMVLGEGNFVLTVSEGKFGQGDHVAYYDLFRIQDGKIVEHWDIIQPIPAREDWKNTNGKF